jgi:hypothetical protein
MTAPKAMAMPMSVKRAIVRLMPRFDGANESPAGPSLGCQARLPVLPVCPALFEDSFPVSRQLGWGLAGMRSPLKWNAVVTTGIIFRVTISLCLAYHPSRKARIGGANEFPEELPHRIYIFRPGST